MAHRIVLIDSPLNENDIARELVPDGFELTLVRPDQPEFMTAMQDAEYLVGFSDPSVNDEFYRNSPRLKLVQLTSAGYDRCDIEAARRAGILICNNGGANSTAVAEHALMLMLAVSRRLVWQHANVAAGRWRGNDSSQARMYELRDRKLGIIGFGTIGRKVARMAQAFGMQVQYYDVLRLSEEQEDTLDVRFRLMHEILRGCDLVSLHVPLLPETRHMIGAAELKQMKPSAYLINTCRGPVINEADLIEALGNGTVAGAGLDVFDREPPPADNPLFTMNNVVLTAHLAGPTYDNQYTRFRNAFDNCQRVSRGEKPLWIIPELRS